jgi:hypothetical protein
MPTILGSSGLGEEESGLDTGLVAQLGRISGKLLSANLLRNGVDLAFETDLLYLKTSPQILGTPSTNDFVLDPQISILREPPYSDGDPNYGVGSVGNGIGINTNNPVYDLDVRTNFKTAIVQAVSAAYIDNLYISAPQTISTTVGEINLRMTGINPTAVFDRLGTLNISSNPSLLFNNNTISSFSNQNINLNPAGLGSIELQKNTTVTGNLYVTGNIDLDGNLRTNSNIIIGNSPMDVVEINTDFTEDIKPGASASFDLGKSDKRWSVAYIEDWTRIGTIRPSRAVINANMELGGGSDVIRTTVLNDALNLSPNTGTSNIEELVFNGNVITSLMQQPDLDPGLTSAGILAAAAGDPNAAIFNTTTTGAEYFLGGGQVVRTLRTGKLGDIRNDLDNPDVLNADDAQKVLDITSYAGSTGNEAIWYHTELKSTILSNPTEYAKWGRPGVAITDTPFTLVSSGTGYVKFSDNSGLVIPTGNTAERSYAEVGATRWNSELQQLECFDGEIYIVATGPGAVVTNDLMVELAITRALFLG